MSDRTEELQGRIKQAMASDSPLQIQAGGSKSFLCRQTTAQPLSVKGHSGIINYDPTELVLTARAGTSLKEIEQTLAASQQILPFEPPFFDDGATLGGAIATGLSGPIRPFTGSARDYVLGCQIINGKGEILKFGGQVMKNVAGYDVSRLMVGAMGTLGLLLEISIKVLPAFPNQLYLQQSHPPQEALRFMRRLSSQNLPLSGLAYEGDKVHIRLAGSGSAVKAAAAKIGGEQPADDPFWHELKEQTHAFFDGELALWRLSLPAATAYLNLPGKQLIDWGGALRWLKSDEPSRNLFQLAAGCAGHARLFRGGEADLDRIQPQLPAMRAIHQKIKHSFDPHGILNPGQLYSGF
ncbi:glycolate oxidase subunit GlcE [Methylophaga sp.]|jgi:glycolate oxidase FAD binding subunit|uniref:glycolate oxidase subunit GlcE n=1 Tax=Methylophaga sp. TaxID=2024840 RepID=UPI0013FFD935|nr:glycolate oxidase subunit GlcE [Methylophaga sp.]MTI64264.1 glycolate oxidase subunit GlcE [Methylophaga sp.]